MFDNAAEYDKLSKEVIKMRTPEQVSEIIACLEREYPLAECSLEYEKPHELLFAVRLAAQCTDERVNMVTPALYERYPSLQSTKRSKFLHSAMASGEA